MLNVIIVDDELLARENLRCLLDKDSQINIVAECNNAMVYQRFTCKKVV